MLRKETIFPKDSGGRSLKMGHSDYAMQNSEATPVFGVASLFWLVAAAFSVPQRLRLAT